MSLPTLPSATRLAGTVGVIDRRRWPARIALWALCLLLAAQALRLAWLVLLPPAPLGAAPVAPTPHVATTTAPGVDPFFPGAGEATTAADASGVSLFGIRTDARGGAAILADADGAQRAYRVGDSVRPGLVLVAVADDHVMLAADGRRQRLGFAEAAAAAATGELPRGRPTEARNGPAEPIEPAQLLAQAGLQPLLEGDRVVGYTLVPRGDGALLRQAGLAAGDVLLAVNGQQLTPERYSALADELTSAPAVTITYRRGTETLTTTVQAPAR